MRNIFACLAVFVSLSSCAARWFPPVSPVFYEGLLAKAASSGAASNSAASSGAANSGKEGETAAEARKKAIALFESALGSPNTCVRQAAAEELLSLWYEGEELSGPALERCRREVTGPWAAAFEALDADKARVKKKALSFLLSSGSVAGSEFRQAALYTLRECRNLDADFFSAAENAAIEGHITAARSRFSEALASFRVTLGEDAAVFLQYPDLLNDLGRCFQYAGAGVEGLELFLEWEKNLAEGQSAETRFRLLFFAARIARQRGLADRGIELFDRALAFAPDSAQADACIWYILDSSLSNGGANGGADGGAGGLAAFIRQLEIFAPQWHDGGYFSDILDRLSQSLVTKRQWKGLIQVFAIIRDCPGRAAGRAATAQYAYIIGRAIAEGCLSPEDTRLAAETLKEIPPSSGALPLELAYLRAAYNAGDDSFYYHAQSAAALDEPFLELTAVPAAKSGGKQSEAMEFLLDFFSNNAADFAPRYISALEQSLSIQELRVLAKALAGADLYTESMRLVTVYTKREDYTPERLDLELHYPRPFKELVERYAAETGLSPALLFGLIRTESAFQSGIISRAGAVGLTQLMPATAEEMAGRIRRQGGPDYFCPLDLQDPGVNIHIGAVYLSYLLDRLEHSTLALLAYNGGMNRVRRWWNAGLRQPSGGLPIDLFLETIEYPETRAYGKRVLAASAVYDYLY